MAHKYKKDYLTKDQQNAALTHKERVRLLAIRNRAWKTHPKTGEIQFDADHKVIIEPDFLMDEGKLDVKDIFDAEFGRKPSELHE